MQIREIDPSREPRRSPGRPKKKKSRAQRNIDWIEEYCRVPEGSGVGKKFLLRPWQQQELRRIYDNPAGTRRAIISFGRKNGKTSLSAAILLLHLCGPEVVTNGQLFSAAQSRDQASLLFNLAAKMVRMSEILSDLIRIRDTNKQLFCSHYGTLYRALSAEVNTAFGLSPVLIIHDELGRVRGDRSELYEALETATGAQAEPLSIIISTQAPSSSDLLSVLIDDAQAGHDPRVILSLHTAAMEDDPFAPETIKKANPAFGDFLNPEEVLGMAADARRMPSREAEFRNLVLNQRVEAEAPFVSRNVWAACGGRVADFEGLPLYGGLDLSEVSDLTALALVGLIDGKWHVKAEFWLPREGLAEKSRLDRVPYDRWSHDGHMKAVPGRSVDYDFVAYRLAEIFDKYDVRKIAFDRWNMKYLKPCLLKAGISEEMFKQKFVEFGQGFQSMSPALRELETLLLNQRLVHDNNPVMNMCATAAVVRPDPAGNRKLDKSKSTQRIDGMVALAMAIGVASGSEPEKKREFQMLFV
jgi:phage terminase large subunit-like protein